jgi:hypothetical protein
MADIVLPTILQGPAYIVHDSVTTFAQAGVSFSIKRDTWNPASAYGPIGPRLTATSATISITPVGMVTAANLNYYYKHFLAPATYVGKSLLASTLVIVDINNTKQYTFAKAALTKPPSLHLGPDKTAFGSMEFTAIGDASVQPLATGQFKTNDGTPSLSTGFEEGSITSDIYKAAWGASPYDAMGSITGFDIDFSLETKNVMAGDIGIADVVLSGLGLAASFAPSSLTEAQLDNLLRNNNTVGFAETLLPGQEIARGAAATPGTAKDLVITGTQLAGVFTAKVQGAESADYEYVVGNHRFKGVKFSGARRWTTGAETALFAHSGVS